MGEGRRLSGALTCVPHLRRARARLGERQGAPGPDECALFAEEFVGMARDDERVTLRLQAEIDEVTHLCLTSPYDRQLIACAQRSWVRAGARLLRQLQAAHPAGAVNQPPGHNPFEPPPVGQLQPALREQRLPVVPASSEAVASLVCGVLAWSCFPLGIVAIWLGIRARRAARENPDRVGGDNLALGGMIVGGIFLALWLVYFTAIAAMVAISALKH